jgi:iron complex transport system substrate-binding protein
MRHPLRQLAATVAALALTLGLAACAGKTDTPAPTTTTSPSGGTYPVTVGSVTLDERPDRIVSISATATEMLFAIGAGPQVVAVDDYSTYPTNAPKTSLSALKPNAEAIAGYRPDLVVLANDTDKIVAQLKTLNIPTLLSPFAAKIDDSYKQIADLGKLTGHTADADALVQRMRDDFDKILSELPRRDQPLSFYYELTTDYYSITSKAFIGSLLAGLGLVNIADAASTDANPFPQLSAEVIIKADPDLIFLADTKCCGQSQSTVAKRPGWAVITAVKNQQVVALDDDIASRWGPRTVDLVRAAADAIAKAPVG